VLVEQASTRALEAAKEVIGLVEVVVRAAMVVVVTQAHFSIWEIPWILRHLKLVLPPLLVAGVL
jgi:hypothetical protein